MGFRKSKVTFDGMPMVFKCKKQRQDKGKEQSIRIEASSDFSKKREIAKMQAGCGRPMLPRMRKKEAAEAKNGGRSVYTHC